MSTADITRRAFAAGALTAAGMASLAGSDARAQAAAAPQTVSQTGPEPVPEPVDVVVIGGGLSGLSAARRLVAAGRRVVVLEARDRVGGRTYHGPIGAGKFDLGAQFVGPTQNRVRALADEFGLALKPAYAPQRKIWELRDRTLVWDAGNPPLPWGTLLDLPHVISRIDAIANQVGPLTPWLATDAAALDAVTVADWAAAHSYTTHTMDLVTCSVRAVFGADPDEISMLFLAFYTAQGDSLEMLTNTKDGAQDSVVVGGTQQLSLRLAEKLGAVVRLNQTVVKVAQSDQGVEVTTAGGTVLRAPRAIIAMPPAVVNAIAFDPPLPPNRRELQARMPMGRYFKVIATYDKPFWRERGFSAEVASVPGPITALYDDDPGDGTGAVLGFIGGDHALAWRALPPDAQKDSYLKCLARWFGDERAMHPTAWGYNNWGEQPQTRGAPVALMAPGVLSRLGPALREPCGRIHWAGTEAAEKWTGYMDGAIRAGEAAGDAVIKALA